MKKITALLFFLFFIFSRVSLAADWVHKSSDDSQVIIDFINTSKVSINGIQVALSKGGEFHAWVRQGDNSNDRYELKFFNWHRQFPQTIEGYLEGGNIIFVGFKGSKPIELWYLEKI